MKWLNPTNGKVPRNRLRTHQYARKGPLFRRQSPENRGHQKLHRNRHRRKSKIIERQIEATDREIDRLVYHLYGLSADEIKIVEEATK
jgi:hypothetical protein